jgi:hypothetical protein
MSLLTGIISQSGEPVKRQSGWGRQTTANQNTTNALSFSYSVSPGELQLIMHYVSFPLGTTPSAPSTPSGFTSLKSGTQVSSAPDGGSNFGYRISYRIPSSSISTTTLPTGPTGVNSQIAIHFIIAPTTGYSFSGLSIADEVGNSYSTSASVSNTLNNLQKNDIALGILYCFYNGALSISGQGGSTFEDYSAQYANPGQLFAGMDLRQSYRSASIQGTMPLGPSIYSLLNLRPTFS